MKFQKIANEVFIVDQFMTAQECADWITFSEAQGYEEAKISIGRQQVINKNIRNNERFIYDSEELAISLWERVKSFVPQELEYGTAIGLNERFRFYKYFPGQQFRPHQDGSYIRSIMEWSSYTFMIYLNEEMEGGATKFIKCNVKPETGKALIFKHELLHEGRPVLDGIKYVLRTDVMYRRKKRS